ncbi:MAG: phosphatidate cytidylyltransferase, partial [bacterium]
MNCVIQFQEIIKALIIGGLFLLIFYLGERVRRKYPANSELSRKTVHLLGGLIALFFPYIFQSHWTVLTLSLSFGFIIFYS